MLGSKVYCKDWLPPFQDNIGPEILTNRNYALIFNCCQLCSAIIGFLSYFLVRVNLVLNLEHRLHIC